MFQLRFLAAKFSAVTVCTGFAVAKAIYSVSKLSTPKTRGCGASFHFVPNHHAQKQRQINDGHEEQLPRSAHGQLP
jgi:hypothetical protein